MVPSVGSSVAAESEGCQSANPLRLCAQHLRLNPMQPERYSVWPGSSESAMAARVFAGLGRSARYSPQFGPGRLFGSGGKATGRPRYYANAPCIAARIAAAVPAPEPCFFTTGRRSQKTQSGVTWYALQTPAEAILSSDGRAWIIPRRLGLCSRSLTYRVGHSKRLLVMPLGKPISAK